MKALNRSDNGQWIHYNDTIVQEIDDLEEFLNNDRYKQDAYILYYKQSAGLCK